MVVSCSTIVLGRQNPCLLVVQGLAWRAESVSYGGAGLGLAGGMCFWVVHGLAWQAESVPSSGAGPGGHNL